jgi:hypothetical protein
MRSKQVNNPINQPQKPTHPPNQPPNPPTKPPKQTTAQTTGGLTPVQAVAGHSHSFVLCRGSKQQGKGQEQVISD